MSELPIIQRIYDLIKWYTPVIFRLPRDHKLMLGNRILNGLYDLQEQLIIARYERDKLSRLESQNSRLAILRQQTKMLMDLDVISQRKYQYVEDRLEEIGSELGGWIKYQCKQKQK